MTLFLAVNTETDASLMMLVRASAASSFSSWDPLNRASFRMGSTGSIPYTSEGAGSWELREATLTSPKAGEWVWTCQADVKCVCVLISLVDTPSLRSHAVPFPSAETPRCEWSGGRWRCTQEGPSGPDAEHKGETMAGERSRTSGRALWWAGHTDGC